MRSSTAALEWRLNLGTVELAESFYQWNAPPLSRWQASRRPRCVGLYDAVARHAGETVAWLICSPRFVVVGDPRWHVEARKDPT